MYFILKEILAHEKHDVILATVKNKLNVSVQIISINTHYEERLNVIK